MFGCGFDKGQHTRILYALFMSAQSNLDASATDTDCSSSREPWKEIEHAAQ